MNAVPALAPDPAAWLDAFGRLHPFVLHLPIGLLLAVALLEVLALGRRRAPLRAAIAPLLVFAALAALLTAATGWRLAAEHPESELLGRHRWCGVAFAASTVLAAVLLRCSRSGRPAWVWLYRLVLLAAVTLLVLAGHLGGSITHGPGFVLEPLQAAAVAEAPPAAGAPPAGASAADSSFARAVAPIFAARCTNCHSSARHKGRLVLQTEAGILAGGKGGPVLAPGEPEQSRLLQRLSLPLDDEHHMPPASKPQLAPLELEVLRRWVAAGAPFTGLVAGLEALGGEPPAAPAAARAALQAQLAHVQELARDSTLLAVDFAARAPELEPELLGRLLAPVVEQVAELGLARTRAADPLLPLLATMPNLRRLDLRATRVTSAGLAALRAHPRLATLIVAETAVDGDAVATLLAMPALRSVFAWRAGFTADALAALRARLTVDDGSTPDAEVLASETEIQLTSDAPLPGAAAALRPVNELCPVSGKAIDPRFVVVDRGRAVGLCCADCAAKFIHDPDAYRQNLK